MNIGIIKMVAIFIITIFIEPMVQFVQYLSFKLSYTEECRNGDYNNFAYNTCNNYVAIQCSAIIIANFPNVNWKYCKICMV